MSLVYDSLNLAHASDYSKLVPPLWRRVGQVAPQTVARLHACIANCIGNIVAALVLEARRTHRWELSALFDAVAPEIKWVNVRGVCAKVFSVRRAQLPIYMWSA